MASAIGMGIPVNEPSGNMVIDIGGGTAEIAVIALSGMVCDMSVRVGGDEMDEAVVSYLKKTYNLLVGESTAEQIKIQVGSAFPLEDELEMEVKGRDLVAGIPKNAAHHVNRNPRRAQRAHIDHRRGGEAGAGTDAAGTVGRYS